MCTCFGVMFWIFAFDWPDAWRTAWSVLAHVLVAVTVIATLGSGLSYVLKTPKVLGDESA